MQSHHEQHLVVHTLSLSSSTTSESPLIPTAKTNGRAHLPNPSALKTHPTLEGKDARLTFVGTATTVLEWEGVRILTDPNFLHAGDHVHLGPGVTGTRLTDPAFPIEDLPPIDLVLLSHFHADHFDQVVQEKLRKDIKIVTTTHAKEHLTVDELGFTQVYGLETWEVAHLNILPATSSSPDASSPSVRITATPGKHIAGWIGAVNDAILGAIPPTNGYVVELGHGGAGGDDAKQDVGFRIYISGDTVMVDELKDIPKHYPSIDLLLIHLGGTSIPSAKAPLVMVTMDAKQGIQLVRLVDPKVTIPIHFDDYDVFASPLSDFKNEVESAGWSEKVVYLDRGEAFEFAVRKGEKEDA